MAGLQFDRVLTTAASPHAEHHHRWSRRRAEIKGPDGGVLFEQDIDAPESWSDLACNIVAAQYCHGTQGTPDREASVRAVAERVVGTIGARGLIAGVIAPGHGSAFVQELLAIVYGQYGSFNSPVWYNVGVRDRDFSENYCWDHALGVVRMVEEGEHRPQASACFIQSVEDSIGGIMALAESEARLFQFGSGTGTNLGTLRSSKESIRGGGRASGPVSFLRVYDATAGTIKSGGKTRRAAKMNTLPDWHPDLLEFVDAKAKEERKAQALIAAGYPANFNGEAYSTVAFQNANLSVRAGDRFMGAARDGDHAAWIGRTVVDGRPHDFGRPASALLDRIAAATHECGDPGLQFDDTINEWHTCPNSGRINTSNPCSEYLFLDDSACNLASVNLLKFRREDGTFDVDLFRHVCRVLLVAQEILVDLASYPTARIAENSHRFRPLGLGYANLGAYLMVSGLAYDSDAGRELAAAITSLLGGTAYRVSAELAGALGPFAGHEANRDPMLRVVARHAEEAYQLWLGSEPAGDTERVADHARGEWVVARDLGDTCGYRHAQVTLLAPTGTIGFMMDCDTTGIEPSPSLVQYKALAGGGTLRIANRSVPAALQALGYEEVQASYLADRIAEQGTAQGVVRDDLVAVFDTALPDAAGRSIHWEGHVRMMAAVQPFLSGAISKTVNMPQDATPEDIRRAYILAWELGVKALAIYRDGSKWSQPVSTTEGGNDRKAEAPSALVGFEAGKIIPLPEGATVEPHEYAPDRERLPETRTGGITHKFGVGGVEGYLILNPYDDGRLAEMFVKVSKEGSTLSGIFDQWATAVSIGLQYGVPLGAFLDKMRGAKFEPAGFTDSLQFRQCRSLPDYFAQVIDAHFGQDQAEDVGIDHDDLRRRQESLEKLKDAGRIAESLMGDLAKVEVVPSADASYRDIVDSAGRAVGRLEANGHATMYRPAPSGNCCITCGSHDLVQTGRCETCHACGSPQGGCG